LSSVAAVDVGTMISLMVLAIGFQLSSVYTPPVTVIEQPPVNHTVPSNHCPLYQYVEFVLCTFYYLYFLNSEDATFCGDRNKYSTLLS